MTDKEKLAKLIAEIKRLYNQSLADENRQADRGLELSANVSYGKSIACKELLSFINSLPEEPISKVWHNINEEPTHFPVLAINSIEDGMVINQDVVAERFFSEYNINKWCYLKDLLHPKEPVGEDLEEAMKQSAEETRLVKAQNGHPFFSEEDFKLGFFNGSKWQKEQDNIG